MRLNEENGKKTPPRIAGVVCELNPLHRGHQFLLRHASGFGAVVCVLSGNFVQRGTPAIMDKWARTELALSAGANLVLELPVSFACACAERFAAGAVFLLTAMGLPGCLVFGSEAGDTDPLWQIAQTLLSPEFSLRVKNELSRGDTFAAARSRAAASLLGPGAAAVLAEPNNILGIEYCKALLQQESPLRPQTILRQGAGHDAPDAAAAFPSAKALRSMLRNGAHIQHLLPVETAKKIQQLREQGQFPARLDALELAILATLRRCDVADFARLPDISEGLEHRLYAAAQSAGSLAAFWDAVKTKRYTHARLRRITIAAFLGLTNPVPPRPPYLRILGMDAQGADLLRAAAPRLPVCVRAADFQKLSSSGQAVFQQEVLADDLYALSMPIPNPCGRDRTQHLIKR